MTSTPESPFNPQDLGKIFSTYWISILLCTLLGGIAFTAASVVLPKKYKTHFVLTIYAKYFQSPLIGDFVPAFSESGEMRSQRESLIRQVLTPEYLDQLGQKYGIYGRAPSGPGAAWREPVKAWLERHQLYQRLGPESVRSAERQDLLSRIDIFSLNSTTFNIGFVYSDPGVAYEVTKDLSNQVIDSLLKVRMNILVTIRDAIRRRVGALATGPETETQKELQEVRAEIASLTPKFTDDHPMIQDLKRRERILVRMLGHSADRAVAGPEAREVYADLAKKLSYLNVAIDSDEQHPGDYFAMLESPMYPPAPLWPKPALFACWGLAFGFFASVFVAALREYFARSTLHTLDLARRTGVPVLGSLPVLPSKAAPALPPSPPTPRLR